MADNYHVYILANAGRRLYTGMTKDLVRRVYEHKTGSRSRFAHPYHIDRLVYFEPHRTAREALARERQIKRWPRIRKYRLIERQNAGWHDLAIDWFPELRDGSVQSSGRHTGGDPPQSHRD